MFLSDLVKAKIVDIFIRVYLGCVLDFMCLASFFIFNVNIFPFSWYMKIGKCISFFVCFFFGWEIFFVLFFTGTFVQPKYVI